MQMPRSKQQIKGQLSIDDYRLPEVNVRLVLKESSGLYSHVSMNSPEAAVSVMGDLLREMDREYLCVVNLDTQNHPINYHVVSIGSINESLAPMQNIFKSAILSNAVSIIVFHNHPSGAVTPSQMDVETTKKIIAAGFLMGIDLVDHIIVGGGTGLQYSFRTTMPELFEQSIPINEIKQRITPKKGVQDMSNKYTNELYYGEFIDYIKEHLKEALPEQYQNAKIEIGDVERINGKYTNLVVKTENEEDLHVLPSINLDDFYMVYLQGTELENVLSSIAETVQHETPEIPLDMFSNYQEAKQHLFVRVMDAETNRDLLKTVPHQMEANLALTYHIQIDLSDGQTGNTIVTNRMMNQFHLTQEQLHQDAMENSQKLYPATLDSMRDMMEELMETSGNAAPDLAEDTPPDMLVVSNGPRVYGASALFYPDQMDQIADAMGGSYYIIPSSIHETLILPDQGVPQGNELNAMIREVNETQVLPKDRLANEAFHYDEQEHVFEPAISYEARQAEKQMNRSERGASRSIREQLEEKKFEIGNRPKKEHPVKHTPERGELV